MKIYDLFQHSSSKSKIRPLASKEQFVQVLVENIKDINKGNQDFLDLKYTEYVSLYETVRLQKYSGISGILGFSAKNTSVEFWVTRGWSLDEAKQKLSERQQLNSVDALVKKKGLTKEEAQAIIDERSQRGQLTVRARADYSDICNRRGNSKNPEYWALNYINPNTGKHYTLQDAQEAISGTQSRIAKQYWLDVKKGNKQYVGNTHLEYYLRQGLSYEDAITALKIRQSTFSREKCIARFGEVEGLRVFQQRQDKWLKTLDGLPEEIKKEILYKKTFRFKRHSNESDQFIEKFFEISGYPKNENCFFGDNEWFIHYRDVKNKSCIYFYDLCLRCDKIIIEYHGSTWHPRPSLTDEQLSMWVNPFSRISGHEQRKRDIHKKQIAEANGFKYFEVWDFEDKQQAIANILESL